MAFRLESGQVINDRYDIIDWVHESDVKQSYIAYDRCQNERVGLRILKPSTHKKLDQATLHTLLLNCQTEIQAVQKLDHPGITAIADCGEFLGHPYFITRQNSGTPLPQWISQRSPTLKQFLSVITQILSALEEAHAKSLCHRNIQAIHVWISGPLKQPVVKLIDWGMAVFENPQAENTPHKDFHSLGIMMDELLCEQLITHSDKLSTHTLSDSVSELISALIKSRSCEQSMTPRSFIHQIGALCQKLSDDENFKLTSPTYKNERSKLNIKYLLGRVATLEKPLVRSSDPEEVTAAGQTNPRNQPSAPQ